MVADEFRSLAENAPDIIDRVDRHFRHLYVNKAVARIHGMPATRIIGKTFRETGVPEPYVSLWEDRIRKVFASARPLTVIDTFPSPAGIRHYESRCIPEFDSQRRIRTVLVISRDITERKNAEDALRRAKDRMDTVLSTITDAYYALDRNLCFTDANRMAEKNTGRKKRDLIGKPLLKLFPAVKTSELYRQLLTALSTQKPVHAEALRSVLTGKWLESHIYPSENGIAVYHRDVTKRKHAEEALKESEIRYRSLFEQAADSIVVFDPKTTRVLDFNNAACRRLGYTRAEFSKLRISDIDIIETCADVRRHGHRVLTRGHRVFETRHKTKSGTIIDVEVWPKAIVLGGKTVILAIWRDITARKQLAEQLQAMNENLEAKVEERTNKLRAMAAEVTQAARKERSRIAHILHEDLQQRLAAMKYKVQALRQTHEGGPAAATEDKLIGELDEAIRITRTLTRRLAPPVLHEMGLYPSLEWLAHDMSQEHALVVRVTGRRVFELASCDLQAFAFDAVRELVLNVSKHAGVDVAEIRIRGAGRNRIAIDVLDGGEGCASFEGTSSFGLFSIRERAQAMGADFTITSVRGKGTRATLILPIR